MIIIGLFAVIIWVIIISIVLVTRSKESSPSVAGREGMSVARQVWLYLITLISLVIFAGGIGQLLSLFLDIIKGISSTQVGGAAFNQQQLSLGLAMTVIGGPLWFFFWRAVQRRVKGNREEIGAALRKLFLNFILTVMAFTAVIAAGDFVKWLLAGAPVSAFSQGGLATMIVAAIIWIYHWRVSETEGQPSSAARTTRRWYMYILAGFGLIWLASGLVQLINAAFINLPIWGNVLVPERFWNNTTQMSIAWILMGGLTWYFHWFRMAGDDFDSTLRQVYFYLLTIAGGAITALVALTMLMFRFFLWIFGGAPVGVSPHFQFLGWAIPAILVGLAIWGYHLRLAQEETGRIQEKRQSAQRVYSYLMSFLSIGTAAAGLSILFGVLLDTGTALTSTAGWWRNQLALCLALLIVGVPLWLYYWNGILKRMQTGTITEWRALSRRIFLYFIIGASIVLLAADLVNVVYQLLRGGLQGNLGANFLNNAKWSLQTLIVAGLLLWYHWQTLRADQRRGAESGVVRKNVTLLADDRTVELSARLESKLGFKVRVLYQVGQTGENAANLPEDEIDRLVNEITAAPGNKVMLVVIGGKVMVMPYQDKL